MRTMRTINPDGSCLEDRQEEIEDLKEHRHCRVGGCRNLSFEVIYSFTLGDFMGICSEHTGEE